MSGTSMPFRSKRPLSLRTLPSAVTHPKSPATNKQSSNQTIKKSSTQSNKRCAPGVSPLQIAVDPESDDDRPRKRFRNSKLDQFFPIEIRETTPIISTLPKPKKLRQGKLDSFFSQSAHSKQSNNQSNRRSSNNKPSASRSLNSSMQSADAVLLSESEDEIEPDSPIVIPGYTDLETYSNYQSLNQPNNQSDHHPHSRESTGHVDNRSEHSFAHSDTSRTNLSTHPTVTSIGNHIQSHILADQNQQQHDNQQQSHDNAGYWSFDDDIDANDETEYDSHCQTNSHSVSQTVSQINQSLQHAPVDNHTNVTQTAKCEPASLFNFSHSLPCRTTDDHQAFDHLDDLSLDIPLMPTLQPIIKAQQPKLEQVTDNQPADNGSSFMFQNAPCDDDEDVDDDVPVFSFGADTTTIKSDPNPIVKRDPISKSERVISDSARLCIPSVKTEQVTAPPSRIPSVKAEPPAARVSKLSLKPRSKVKQETNISTPSPLSAVASDSSDQTHSSSNSTVPASPPPLEVVTQLSQPIRQPTAHVHDPPSQTASRISRDQSRSADTDEIDLTGFSPAQLQTNFRIKVEQVQKPVRPPVARPASPPPRSTLPGPLGRIQRSRPEIEPFSFDQIDQQPLHHFSSVLPSQPARQPHDVPPRLAVSRSIPSYADYPESPVYEDFPDDPENHYDPDFVIDDDDNGSVVNEDDFHIHEDDFASDVDIEDDEPSSQVANTEFANSGFDTSYSFRRLSELRQTGDLAFDAEANLAAKAKRRQSRVASSAKKNKATSNTPGSDDEEKPRKALVGFWTGGRGGRSYHHPSGRVFTGRTAYMQYKKLMDKYPAAKTTKAASKRKAKPKATKKRTRVATSSEHSDPPARSKAQRKSKAKPKTAAASTVRRAVDETSDEEAEWAPESNNDLDFD